LDPKEFKAALASVGLPGASAKVVGLILKSAAEYAKHSGEISSSSSSSSSSSAALETEAEASRAEPATAAAALKKKTKTAAKAKANSRSQELNYESFAAMLQQPAST
jgi:hypothetical protein